jgi:Outer membrane protein beta-barrel domain
MIMRQIYLMMTIALISVSVNSYSQTKFGIRAGLSVSNWQGDAVQTLQSALSFTGGYLGTASKPGFHAGGYATIPVSEMVSIEPGVQYSQKGYTVNGELDIKSFDFLSTRAEVQMHYIDVPVFIKVKPAGGLTIYAGPQFSYMLKTNLRARAAVLGFNLLNKTIDITNAFNRTDIALAGGVGYEFKNGFNINAGYDYGLSRIDKNSNFNARNRNIKVSVGFNF